MIFQGTDGFGIARDNCISKYFAANPSVDQDYRSVGPVVVTPSGGRLLCSFK